MSKNDWKKIYIDGTETIYSVNSEGEVRNDIRNRLLTPQKNNGYLRVALSLGHGKMKNKPVHRLVAEAFIPNPKHKEFVNHIDGDRSNPNVKNLEWVTSSENAKHAHKTGLVGSLRIKPVRQYNLNGKFMMVFESAAEAERQLNISQSKICEVCKGTRRTAGEYQWRYDEENIEELEAVPKPSCTKKRVAQYDKEGNFIAQYESYKAAARAVNGTSSAISRICSNTPGLHTHKGYVWKIVDDIVQEETEE